MIIRYVRVRRILILLLVVVLLAIAVGNSRPFLTLFYPIPYEEEILETSGQFGLDPYLVTSVIRVESNFDPQAESPKGALGLMQLMPDTAEWAATKINLEYSREKLFDPDFNITLGCWYLSLLTSQYDGNTAAVLAAYNGGNTTVNQWLADGLWNGTLEDVENIPYPETSNYVKKVSRTLEIYTRLYKN